MGGDSKTNNPTPSAEEDLLQLDFSGDAGEDSQEHDADLDVDMGDYDDSRVVKPITATLTIEKNALPSVLLVDQTSDAVPSKNNDLLLPLDLRLTINDEASSEQLKTPKFYSDVSTKMLNHAEQSIEDLNPADRKSWLAHQLSIAEAKSPQERETAKAARAAAFPEIVNEIQCAELILNSGAEESKLQSLEKYLDPNLMERTRHHLRHNTSQSSSARLFAGLEQSPSLTPLSDREIDGLLALDAKLNPDRKNGNKPELYRSDSLLSGRQLFVPLDDHGRPTNAPAEAKARNESDEIRRRLYSLENPNLTDALHLRGQSITEKLSGRLQLPPEWNERLRNVQSNPYMTLERKVEALSHVDRLISDAPNSVADAKSRDVLGVQIILQSGKIETVDQGQFGVCNMSAIQKVLSINHLDEVSRMIADVALNGSTISALSKREVRPEPAWLQASNDDALELYKDDARSLFTQYMSMIGGDLRFQSMNEKYGTHLRYGINENGERVLDYSGESPREIYGLSENGKFKHESITIKFPDGRMAVDEDLQQLRPSVEDSPFFFVSDILDVYEEISGQKDNVQMLCHYDMARMQSSEDWSGKFAKFFRTENPEDSRISIYRNESELTDLLRHAPYPKFFVQPGHILTVNGYNPLTNRADYDNTHGSDRDRLGASGMTPSELLAKGDPAKDSKPDKNMDYYLALRVEYESWCAEQNIEVDSRYPSKEELAKFRGE